MSTTVRILYHNPVNIISELKWVVFLADPCQVSVQQAKTRETSDRILWFQCCNNYCMTIVWGKVSHRRLPRIMSSQGLNVSTGWHSTAPAPVSDHPHGKQEISCVEAESCVSVCVCCLLSCLWAPQKGAWLPLLPGMVSAHIKKILVSLPRTQRQLVMLSHDVFTTSIQQGSGAGWAVKCSHSTSAVTQLLLPPSTHPNRLGTCTSHFKNQVTNSLIILE